MPEPRALVCLLCDFQTISLDEWKDHMECHDLDDDDQFIPAGGFGV